MYYLYNIFLILFSPLILLVALPIFLARKKHRGNFFLRCRPPSLPLLARDNPGPSIWIHAVSVGEVLSSLPLVKAVRSICPEAIICFSTITLTGFEVAGEHIKPDVDFLFYLPFDIPFLMKKAVSRVSPDLVVIMETELWPNLIWEANMRGAKVVIVNGRISDRSFPRYRKIVFFLRSLLKRVDLFLMQSKKDRDRIVSMGAQLSKVEVMRNLKYDLSSVSRTTDPMLEEKIYEIAGGRAVVIGGSTHEGEEEMLIEVTRPYMDKVLLILAPRHPERFDSVETKVLERGHSCLRRSALENRKGPKGEFIQVILLDTMGELQGLYAISDVVVMGGSLVNVGGHNILEPAIYKKAVIIGPYYSNFKDIVEEFIMGDGLIIAHDLKEFQVLLRELVEKEELRKGLGDRAYKIVSDYTGIGNLLAERLIQMSRKDK
jgi:3-deoxy-D-manno-octulosonic-acid transferase